MALEVGTIYVPATAAEIRDDILTDIRLESRKYGVEAAIQPGTDDWIWATAVANAAMLQYANIAVARDDITPMFATDEGLERWRIALGLPAVQPSPATGKIIVSVTGSATIPGGTQFVYPNGFRGQVVGTWTVTDGSEIDVASIDRGSEANLDPGVKVRFVSPPMNVGTEAKVSGNAPLRGGMDAETTERKRERVLNASENNPSGGNWAHARQIVMNELASVANCFVYPALGGPASMKVVPLRAFDSAASEYTREMSPAALDIVRNALHRELCDAVEIVVQAAQDEPRDVSLALDLPASALAGGNGGGWTDAAPWPLPSGGATAVTVSTQHSTTEVSISGASGVPLVGQTHVAWWSPDDMRFRVYLVIAATHLGGTDWRITLDRPLVSSNGLYVAPGDYISPASANIEAYGKTWLRVFEGLGPGENTSEASRLPRALRHPFVSDAAQSRLGSRALKAMLDAHPEIREIAFKATPPGPTVPASVADPPRVLVPRHLGIYRTF